jgi:hypothetical protein
MRFSSVIENTINRVTVADESCGTVSVSRIYAAKPVKPDTGEMILAVSYWT